MSGYFALLKLAPVRRMLLAAFLSRVPMGILGLATVLFLHQEGRSYAVAGLVGGTIGFGLAISAVLQARIVNRRGRASLAAVAGAFALLAIALIVGGFQGWPALGSRAARTQCRRVAAGELVDCPRPVFGRGERSPDSSEACSRSIPP